MNLNEENNIDNLFKEKLAHLEVPVQPGSFDAIYNKANAKNVLNDNDKKTKVFNIRNFVPYLAAAVIVGVTILVGLFFQNSNNTHEISIAAPANKTISPTYSKPSTVNIPTKEDQLSKNTFSNDDVLIKIKEKKIDRIAPKTDADYTENLTVTTNADIQNVVLPDSSIVTLNKYSTISYSKNYLENRKMQLAGEAFFVVKKYMNKSFRIECANSIVEVLGTSFNVRTKGDDEKISVVTGKVSVESKISGNKSFITHGEELVVNKDGKVTKSLMGGYTLAWQTKKLDFHKEPVKNVLPAMEDYFSVKIDVRNPDILNCTFTGKFEKPTIDEFLEIFSSSLNLSYKRSENKFLLDGNGCK